MNHKKFIWKILLLLGLIPFIVVSSYGLFKSINGFSGLCILGCIKTYGFLAFIDSVILFSYLLWPFYIIGLILILLSIIKLKKK